MDSTWAQKHKTYLMTHSQVEDMKEMSPKQIKNFLYGHGFPNDKPITVQEDICGLMYRSVEHAT